MLIFSFLLGSVFFPSGFFLSGKTSVWDNGNFHSTFTDPIGTATDQSNGSTKRSRRTHPVLKVDRLSLLQKWELVANKSTHLPVVPLSLHFCFVSLSLSLSLSFFFIFLFFIFLWRWRFESQTCARLWLVYSKPLQSITINHLKAARDGGHQAACQSNQCASINLFTSHNRPLL